ncbi:DNA N-6-adenine-methyltransferase, partial [Escherichia coli]
IEPSTGLEKKGNSKGSMLLIWRPFISPRRMFTTVSKAALMAIGQEAVDEIESNHNRHRWTVEECRAIKAEYQQKLKDLRNSRS